MSEQSPLLEQLEERVLTLTLNRPAARNAIDADLAVRLSETVQRAAGDDRVGAIVITGAGGTFCAGGDVKGMAKSDGHEQRTLSVEELLLLGGRTVFTLHTMPKPTIAMIRGPAAGGGLALALGCDLRLADETAKLTFAYTRIGLSGDFGCAWLLQKWMGPARAREFCLHCPTIDAAQALSAGLVNEVHDPGTLPERVQEMARGLANGPTGAIGRIKANLDASSRLAPEDYLAFEADNFLTCRQSDEHREALGAFMAKRAPSFHTK